MNRLLTTLAFLALASTPTHAGGMIGWGDAAGGGMELTSPCTPPDQVNELVCAFNVPPELSKVTRLEMMIDFCVGLNPLPPWWGGAGVELCTPPSLTADADMVLQDPIWNDYWGGLAEATMEYEVPPDTASNMGRMRVSVVIDPEDATAPSPSVWYYAFRVVIDATGADCAGCNLGACFVINEVKVTGPEGEFTSYGDYLNRYASWNSGIPGCPFIVPVEDQTVGTLKSRYDRSPR